MLVIGFTGGNVGFVPVEDACEGFFGSCVGCQTNGLGFVADPKTEFYFKF